MIFTTPEIETQYYTELEAINMASLEILNTQTQIVSDLQIKLKEAIAQDSSTSIIKDLSQALASAAEAMKNLK